MLIEFNYKLGQVYYIRSAMAAVPPYRPDNRDVPWVDRFIASCKAARSDYLPKLNALTLAQGSARQAQEKLHDACVGVHQCMRSCYRKDSNCLNAIDNVPVQDQSEAETLDRGQKLNTCWATLPNPPEWTTPFKVADMDRTAFDGLVTGLETAIQNESSADQIFQLSEGAFRKQKQVMTDFVTAALTQGRGQFAPGTPEREAIDRVPTEAATQPPAQAQITQAESQAEGSARLSFDAEHATSFQVWHKGPGEEQFTQVEDAIRPGEYSSSGLAQGSHAYKVVGVNSRGEGPPSEVVTIAVAEAAAA